VKNTEDEYNYLLKLLGCMKLKGVIFADTDFAWKYHLGEESGMVFVLLSAMLKVRD